MQMDGVVSKFPKAYMQDASPRAQQLNFHPKTREACSTGNVGNISLKIAKIIVIGDLNVGKTSVVNRYCRNQFEKDYKPTIGVEYEVKKYAILGQEFHLQLWDTSGEERFKCITSVYYRGAHCVIVVFDLTEIRSLRNCKKWLDEALEQTRTAPEIYLVGNKKDVKNPIQDTVRTEAVELANEMNAEYWEVSAKSGENVLNFFTRVASVTFDQAILRELDSLRHHTNGQIAIGGGAGIATNKRETIKLKDDDDLYETKEKKRSCCSKG